MFNYNKLIEKYDARKVKYSFDLLKDIEDTPVYDMLLNHFFNKKDLCHDFFIDTLKFYDDDEPPVVLPLRSLPSPNALVTFLIRLFSEYIILSRFVDKYSDFDLKTLNTVLAIHNDKKHKELSKYLEKKEKEGVSVYFNTSVSEEESTDSESKSYTTIIQPSDKAIIGRDKEIIRLASILNRKEKANAILVGEAGVGKTAIVKGLSSLIDEPIYELDIVAMLAGTRYRGDFEERLKNLLDDIASKSYRTILFIDEIHTIIGAGITQSKQTGMVDTLKPYLTQGNLQLIGCTTKAEYNSYIADDKALTRRFHNIYVDELDKESVMKVLKANKKVYEEFHNIKARNIEYLYDMADRYLSYGNQPDISFDLLDDVMVMAKGKGIKNTTKKIINEALSEKTGIPIHKLTTCISQVIDNLEVSLKENIIGQDLILSTITEQLLFGYSYLHEPDKPIASYLFTGHTGVGKTETAKIIAEELSMQFLRLDMSEYSEPISKAKLIGSPPGYVGYEEGGVLTDKLKFNPYTVILLDEIEKSHPEVRELFLQILDRGVVTDSFGQELDCTNTIIIATSNSGATYKPSIGFGSENMSIDQEVIESTFSPELRNRFDRIIQFNTIDKESAKVITNNLLEEKLSDKDLDSVLDYDSIRKNGVREIKKVVRDINFKKLKGLV